MNVDLQEKYLQVKVQTATPEALITMLYDGAVRFLRQAKANLTRKDISQAHNYLMKAEAIVNELNNCLDMGRGEVAQSFRKVYDYLLERIVEANTKKDAAIIDEVIGHILGLREAWNQAVRSVNGSIQRR